MKEDKIIQDEETGSLDQLCHELEQLLELDKDPTYTIIKKEHKNETLPIQNHITKKV